MSYLAAKLGGTVVIRPQMNWALWPGNVLLVSVLLLVQRKIWPMLIAASFAAFVFYDLQAGIPLRSTALLILTDTVEVLTAALCLSYSFGGTPELNSVKALVKYSFFAVFLAPFLGAFLGALATNGDYWIGWRISFFSEALGFLILAPAILGWVRTIPAWVHKQPAYYMEATVLLAALVVIGYFAFADGKSVAPALLYSPVPFLLWSALRFESVGVCSSVLVVVLLSIWGVVHGRGPFIESGPLKNVFALQLFLFFTAAPFIVLAALVQERKEAGRALKKSEEKFSKAFLESPLAFTLTSAKDHRYIEVNETFERITGWSHPEVIGRTPFDLGIWEDAAQRHALVKHLLAHGSSRNIELRFRTKNGEVRSGLGSAELIEIDREPCVLSLIMDVTEHKQIQEKLGESQSRLEGIVASAMDAIIAVDQDQRIVVFNEAAQNMFGCSARDAIGSSVSRFIPQRFRDAHADHIRRFGEAGVTNRSMGALDALWALRTNGEEFPIEASISHTETAGKKLFTVIIRDITERKQAEEARFRHAAIVESLDDAIVSKDLQGIILSWNRGAQRLFGFTEAEAVGRPITIITPEELQEEENEILRRTKSGEHIEHYETVRLTKGRKRLDVSLTISPLRDWTGKVVGSSKIVRDITHSKQAEAALRESEKRFRLVANTAPVMIWMSGPDKLCSYFNQPWLDFTGRSIQAEMGNGWADGVHPEDLERCMDTYSQAFDRRERFEMEYRLRRHDGEYRWVFDLGVPRWNADGSIAGYIGSCLDVTERKRAEEALSSVSRRLIEAHEEERNRIARELHDDINQRIALLAVNLERLKRDLPAPVVVVSRGLEEMREHVSNLASDVQALSHRLHSSKLEYLGIATAASSFCKELSESQGVEIDFHSEGLPKNLPQDIALCLFRVLQEALQNAVKHSGSHHLKVSLVGASNAIQLTVRDPGIGFDLQEAFEGTGLGLTSMKERLKLVRGELSIDSGPQRGTLILATVPLDSGTMRANA
jgi:PAS domain S-box-containing protein